MRIGTVKQIWRYPVKSMAGEQLETCTVGLNGVLGDRGWAVRDETAGEITNGKRFPLLMRCSARYHEAPANGAIPHVDMLFPDGLVLSSDVSDINARLTELLGNLFRCGHYNRRVTLNTIDAVRRLHGYSAGLLGSVRFVRRYLF